MSHLRRLTPRGLLQLSVVCLLFGASSATEAFQKEITALEPGTAIERDFKGGEVHIFRVHLSSGWFLHVVVDQRGIDVEVTVFRPDGRQLAKLDSPNADYGPEPVVLIAEEPGDYRLEVSSPNKRALGGRYEIRIVNLREATLADKNHAAAEKAFDQGQKLRSQRTAASLNAAIEKYQEALPFFQSSSDRYRQALILNTIGGVYAQSSEFRRALEYFDQALSLWRAVRDHLREASTLNNIGGAYDILGESQKALEYYAQALPLFREKRGQSLEAITLNNIGKIHQDLAAWQKALDYYNQALPIFRAVGDQRREANVLHNIGVAYRELGETEKALEYYRQALLLRRATGDKAGEAYTLSSTGLAYAASGEMQKALASYNLALQLQRTAGDRRGEGTTLDYVGLAYSAVGEREKALEYHRQAAQLQRAAEDRRGEASALANIGHVYNVLRQPQKALEYLNRALAFFQAIGDRNNTAKALQGIALAERGRGNLLAARQQIEAAIPLFEGVRADVISQELRTSYFASQRSAYEFYIDLLMRLHEQAPSAGFDAIALQTTERARARSLLEMLAESRADIRGGVDAELLAKERSVMQQINAKAERLMPLVGTRGKQEQVETLNKEMRQLETDYQQVRTDIRQNSPHYAAIVQPQPLGLKSIQERVLDRETIVLEYSLGKEQSYLWAITSSSLTSYELPKEEQVKQASEKVLNLLTTRSRSLKGETAGQKQARFANAEASLHTAARELSQMLLGPVASLLGHKRLVIVADGILQYIPFAMLPSPNSRSAEPLIVAHEMISLPSASTLAVQRQELSGRKSAPRMVAVIADPVFSLADERLKPGARNTTNQKKEPQADTQASIAENSRIIEHLADNSPASGRMSIPRLPFTRLEADQIISIAAGKTNLEALDFKANRATVTSAELREYRYVHFATHGYLDSERPGLSALVLSMVDEQGKSQDGFLRANEIYNLNLPAELVVLSACQTGLGKEIRGEGLIGLTRGFMYAGAARVVVSLWNVNDKATAELMQRFYKAMLKDNQRPAAALRNAQVEMWKQKQWQAPYYWAAFVLQGEWR